MCLQIQIIIQYFNYTMAKIIHISFDIKNKYFKNNLLLERAIRLKDSIKEVKINYCIMMKLHTINILTNFIQITLKLL